MKPVERSVAVNRRVPLTRSPGVALFEYSMRLNRRLFAGAVLVTMKVAESNLNMVESEASVELVICIEMERLAGIGTRINCRRSKKKG